jgi:hypothetical protein
MWSEAADVAVIGTGEARGPRAATAAGRAERRGGESLAQRLR